jgi:hypothetical protein
MSDQRLQSTGVIKYHNATWITCEISPDFGDYYRSWIPSGIIYNKPRYDPHITVLRAEYEPVQDMTHWGEHEGEAVSFEYDPDFNIDGMFIMLDVYSDRLEEIRMELGLPHTDNCFLNFHITIGNRKNL